MRSFQLMNQSKRLRHFFRVHMLGSARPFFPIPWVSDRVFPIVMITFLEGSSGFLAYHLDNGQIPPACPYMAVQGLLLDCKGQGDYPGARVFLDGQKLDINKARARDLMRVPRLHKRVARSIIAFRQARGRFETLEELQDVEGLGEKTFMHIKPYLILHKE